MTEQGLKGAVESLSLLLKRLESGMPAFELKAELERIVGTL